MTDKITFFASGNGDSVLIQAQGKTVMTDINYRSNSAQDEDDDEVLDFLPDIKSACSNDHLDVFILTHPDQDHLRGYGEVFHIGIPEYLDTDPEDGQVKVIVDEIWCSPYSLNPNYTTDASKPVLDEIKRRGKLQGTEDGLRDGNRLKVMDTSSEVSGDIVSGFSWRLLAPTIDEANIPISDDPDNPNSSNSSSLVIQWIVSVNGQDSYIILAGDSIVENWERIYDDHVDKNEGPLAWHILLAPHHCSRHSIGRVEGSDTEDEIFVSSDKAEAALGFQEGSGHIISSSLRVIRGGQTPPSYQAKNRYLKILSRDKEVSNDDKSRFICTSGEKEGDKPEHVSFNFTAAGPSKAILAAPFIGSSSAASGQGGGYGNSR